MAKIADKYFDVDQWKIIERGFNPEYGEVAESVFSLGNEYMGVRGYFDEGYSGKKLIGSYFNGIYERTKPDYGHYKGIVDFTEYMVNSADWLYTRISIDGEKLDAATADISGFERELDLRSGRLTRRMTWTTTDGKATQLEFERILSMTDVHRAGQRITVTPLNYSGELTVVSGIDFSVPHQGQKRNMWNNASASCNISKGLAAVEASTIHTKQRVFSGCIVTAEAADTQEFLQEKTAALSMILNLKKGVSQVITKHVKNFTCKDEGEKDKFFEEYKSFLTGNDKGSFDQLLDDNKKWWSKVWEHGDIVIDGDPENQQGIRFCIFQMFQTYHGAVKGTNIGAKGLTGEAYNGNAFWDTETYCLPFFLFNDRKAAENLLYFRYKTLDEARARAKELDCQGAFYPIATISGRECCNLWQHASLQLQASTGVAYGIWIYEKIYNDYDFICQYGLEMLIEISRMLATRGGYSQDGRYGYYGVMGPDEFQMMVNNNCYTNYMGKFTLEYTLKVLHRVKRSHKKAYAQIIDKVGFKESEEAEWKKIIKAMYIPYNKKTMLYEQNDGFFKLPHVDVDAIPVQDFPLYHNWSYDRIYRNDMIKQPDVLMFMLMFNSSFTNEQLKANYEYYEPRTIHESSLSPSVHSILATQLNKSEEAYSFFEFATRMDLDNYNRNTQEGIHTTSIAAAWMNIVYGFGGVRSDGELLVIAPVIPDKWNSYSFKITYQDAVITVRVEKGKVRLTGSKDPGVRLKVYDREITLGTEEYCCSICEKSEA